MNAAWEKPNLISVIILLVVLGIGAAYVLITLDQRPETESFTVDDDYFFPYNFDRLDRVVRLPSELDEISGLCQGFDPDEVFAVQDEEGVLFLVNSMTGDAISQIRFNEDRDYEGVARLDSQIYVLEADGDIHYFTYRDSVPEIASEKLETQFSYRNDAEGICYDPVTNTLLVVPKEQELEASDDNQRRGIYTFSLERMRLDPRPTYFIDELEVGQIVFDNNREYIVKPSGIAVDPITEDIFILSAVGRILVVIDRDSQIKHVELLEPGTFRQPEGIAFSEDGDLYISSEGRGGRGMIATLSRKEQPVANE